MKRVFTALALILFVPALILAPPLVFAATVGVLTVIGLREFFNISAGYGIQPFRVAGLGAGLLLVLFPDLDKGFFLTLFALALLVLGFQAKDRLEESLPAAAVTLIGVLYVAGPLLCGRLLRDLSPHWLLLVIVVNAVGDTAAFYVGKAIGKRPLAPRVSPHKTWEGALGSVLFAVIAGAFYANRFLEQEIGLGQAAGLALAVNVVAQFGDLAESALKRGAHLKDSGNLLPGHGGLLDRIDGMLFSFPLVYGFLYYWK